MTYPRWEYHRRRLPITDLIRQLDEIGEEGWELCATLPGDWYVFKRQVRT